MNAQVFKSEAVPVMAKVDIDPAVRDVKPFKMALAPMTYHES